MLLNTRQRKKTIYSTYFIAFVLTFLLSVSYSVFAANPYESDIVSWGSMQMLDRPAIAIAAGYYHTVALKEDSTVVAWGDDAYGETSVPAGLDSIKAIAAGRVYTVALRENGTVVAWGDNSYGQMTIPVGLDSVMAIAAGAGGYHTVVLRENGTVVAWGWNNYGQTTVPAGLDSVIAIAAGGYHTVVLRENGKVAAWGNNNYGQTTVPVGLDSVKAIAAGYGHTVALLERGTTVVRNREIIKFYKKFSLSYKAGSILFSTPLPAGTVFTLFDLNGRVIFRADVHGTSLKLPLRSAHRVALWRVEHPKLIASGRLLLR
jgi:alpha-tubulin suppressor-like RCC1 family protein